jgi:hypothetical protein
VVGVYLDPSILKNEGYLFGVGAYRQVKYPGASTTYPAAINNNGWIVGTWFTSLGAQSGFVAMP